MLDHCNAIVISMICQGSYWHRGIWDGGFSIAGFGLASVWVPFP